MMSHIDCWATLATMVGLTPPPHDWVDNNGKGIYFDSIDNSAYILGKAEHSARDSWVYIDGENFMGARADIGGDPENPDVKIAWKYLWTAKDTWLGPTQNLGAIGACYNLTMDPFEKYDMTFNGATSTRLADDFAGKVCGPGQWLGIGAHRASGSRVRQDDREVSEHQAIPGWRLKRHHAESSDSGKPRALAGYEQAAEQPEAVAAECGWFDSIAKTRGPLRQGRLANSPKKPINEAQLKRNQYAVKHHILKTNHPGR